MQPRCQSITLLLQARMVLPDANDLAGIEEDDEAEFGGKLQLGEPAVPDVPAAPAASPVPGKDSVAGMKQSNKTWAGARCCLRLLQQSYLCCLARPQWQAGGRAEMQGLFPVVTCGAFSSSRCGAWQDRDQ